MACQEVDLAEDYLPGAAGFHGCGLRASVGSRSLTTLSGTGVYCRFARAATASSFFEGITPRDSPILHPIRSGKARSPRP